jgi:hypothetical protein
LYHLGFAAAVFSSLSISAAAARRGIGIFGSRSPLWSNKRLGGFSLRRSNGCCAVTYVKSGVSTTFHFSFVFLAVDGVSV